MTLERHSHGTSARYAHGPAGDGVDPCRDACCREAHNAARRKRRKTDAYGRGTRDAEPVRAHVEALHAAGMPIAEITRRAHVPARTVGSLLYEMGGRPRTARVTQATAVKLLAVTLPTQPTEPEALMWPAHGTRRRLQALVAVGWSLAEVSRRLDVDHKHLHRIVGHRGGIPPSTVTPATHTAVADLYDRLWDQAPPRGSHDERTAATRAIARAQAKGWAVPAAWDDDEIDRPAARPAGARRDVQLEEDVTRLLDDGLTVADIARRLGRNQRVVSKVRDRIRREAEEAA